MKITAKTTKQELKNILNANVNVVKEQDKNLYDRIVYTGKKAKEDDSKVTRKDLVDLVKEVITVLGDKIVEPQGTPAETPVEPKAENSIKKLAKGAKKQKAESSEKVGESEQTAEETQEEPAKEEKAEKVDKKKSAKKSLGNKKEQPKKDGVTVLDDKKSKKAVQLAKQFPLTLEVEDKKYELASDIKTMEDLYNALEGDEPQELIFAHYWTKRHLKQFTYFRESFGQPESFENDLDLSVTLHISDEKKVVYVMSMYTEALYCIIPHEILEEGGIRFNNGIEFQIYRAV